MKQLLFILFFSSALIAGNSSAHETNAKKLLDNQRLFSNISNINLCCAVNISIDQFIIDEQENNEFDGFSFFVDNPEIQLVRLNSRRFSIHPVIWFTPQLKVVTLLSDLPPPRLS